MQIKLLHDLIEELAGENTGRIVEILFGKKDVNEFLIAKKMELTINQVRNILYKLSADNLVSFVRKKDKRKGWYIYYWTLNKNKVKEALVSYKKKQLQDFKLRLAREQKSQFFFCPTGCMRMTMENAMDHDFKCQECGSLLRPLDNQRTIENIKQRILELEEELSQPIVVEKEKRVGKKKVKKKVAKKVKKKVVKKIKKVKKVAKKAKKVKKKVVKKVKKKVVKKKVKKKVSKIPKKKSKVARILKNVGKRLKKKKK